MKTMTITIMAAAVVLDNLEGMYRHATKLAAEGHATPAARLLIAAYDEIENAFKAAQKGSN